MSGVHLLVVRRAVQSGTLRAARHPQFSAHPGDATACRPASNESWCATSSSKVFRVVIRRNWRRRSSYHVDAGRRCTLVRPHRTAAGCAGWLVWSNGDLDLSTLTPFLVDRVCWPWLAQLIIAFSITSTFHSVMSGTFWIDSHGEPRISSTVHPHYPHHHHNHHWVTSLARAT